MIVGLISDTHGLLRPQAIAALQGSSVIIHAGDVGKPEILERLRAIAPTFAVRGNIDTQPWASALPTTVDIEVWHLRLHVLHQVSQLDRDPAAAKFAGVIYGHSHQSSIETRDGVLFINPGSAGPRRFKLPVTIARLSLQGGELQPEIVDLNVGV